MYFNALLTVAYLESLNVYSYVYFMYLQRAICVLQSFIPLPKTGITSS